MKGGERWKDWLRHKLGNQPKLIDIASGDGNSNINIWLRKIDWPWFRVVVTRRAQEDWIWGAQFPRRFGRAYNDFDRDTTTYMMVPFNFIAAFWRALMIEIKWKWPQNLQQYEHDVATVVRRRIQAESPKMWEAGYAAGKIDGAHEELEKLKQYQESLRNTNG